MLNDKDAIATIAVKSVDRARKFYQGVLGLEPVGAEGDEVITFRTGNTKVLVYRSDYAGTNEATAVTWSVGDDLEGVVSALADKGVKFQHYDFPGLSREGDIHVGGGVRVAWFKDPDGNILALTND